MHIFGLFLICLIGYGLYKFRDIKELTKYTIALLFVTYFFFNIGYFFKIGNVEVLYFEFFLYIFYVLNFLLILKTGLTKKEIIIISVFIISIVLNNVFLIIDASTVPTAVYPHSWHEFLVEGVVQKIAFTKFSLIYDIYILMIPISIINIKKNYIKKDFLDILHFVFFFAIFTIGYSCIEFFIKIFVSPTVLSDLRNFLFGITNFTVLEGLERNGIPVIMGFLREPSSFAYSVFITQLISYALFDKKKSALCFCLGTLLGFLSGSFSYIVLVLLSLTIYIFRYYSDYIYKNYKRIILIFVSCIIISVVILSQLSFSQYYIGRILNVFSILNGTFHDYTSEFERIYSSITNLNVFANNLLLGAGIGTTYSFSTICSLLANYGLVGLTLFGYVFYYGFLDINFKKNKAMFIILISSIIVIFLMFGAGINSLVYSELLFFGIIVKCLLEEKTDQMNNVI